MADERALSVGATPPSYGSLARAPASTPGNGRTWLPVAVVALIAVVVVVACVGSAPGALLLGSAGETFWSKAPAPAAPAAAPAELTGLRRAIAHAHTQSLFWQDGFYWNEHANTTYAAAAEAVTHLLLHEYGSIPHHIVSPLPGDIVTPAQLPPTWDWRNVDGRNFLGPVLNQHVPRYSGCCYAFAAVAALTARIKIARKARWPDVDISVQSALNCAPGSGEAGGLPSFVYDYARTHGLVDTTCLPFTGETHACDPMGQCKICYPGYNATTKQTDWSKSTCRAVPANKHTTWKVSEHGDIVNNIHHMKAEIYKRGPIACYMSPSPKFDKHFAAFDGKDKAAVFSQHTTSPFEGQHVVTVVGWTAATATEPEAWVVQNSDGLAWGDKGFFKIELAKDNLFLNARCSWAVPIVPDDYKV